MDIFEETWRALRAEHGGRHRWDGPTDPLPDARGTSHAVDSTTEEIRLPQQPQVDVHIYEPTDPRLKRHVVHDERSRSYALTATAKPAKPIQWQRVGPVLDQGEVGSCTANAALGLLMTQPFSNGTVYTEQDALALYSEETRLDDSEIPGHYPPTDSGSAGIYAMKALQARGLITAYQHAFSLNAALAALTNGPIAVGTVWLDEMMTPTPDNYLTVSRYARTAGGHEYVVDGYDPQRDAVHMTNSWSSSWGVNGGAWIKTADFGWLLSQQGDVVQPTVAAKPTPGPVSPTPQPPAPSDDSSFYAQLRQWVTQIDAWLRKHGA